MLSERDCPKNKHETLELNNRIELWIEKEDGLKALGAKTQYRMDYAPEVLETFSEQAPWQ